MDTRNHSQPTGDFVCTAAITSIRFEVAEEPVVQILSCVLAIPMCFTAALANLLVIISILGTPSLNSPSNILLGGLAFSDFGVGLVALPAYIVSMAAKIRQEDSLFCISKQAEVVSAYCLCTVSLLTLSVVSLDRYVAIHYHLRYQAIVTAKRVRLVLVAIWAVGSYCGLIFGLEKLKLAMITTHTLLLLSLSIIIFASCSIYRVIRRHQRQIASQIQVQISRHENEGLLNLPRARRSFANLQILCWSLLLCFLPYALVSAVLFAMDRTSSKQDAFELSVLLVYINSVLNPFLYCWRYRPIRVALLRVLRSISSHFDSLRSLANLSFKVRPVLSETGV